MKHGNLALFVPHLGCAHRCSFCDQRAISGAVALPTPADVVSLCESAAGERTFELAFFGGSFTAINPAYMTALLSAAQPFLGKRISGIRVSTRPDAVDAQMLRLLCSYGVTAIELGAQSMDDRVLERNGRGHTAADVVAASNRILSHGFSLGLQMMLGLDGAGEQEDILTAKALIDCYPDTVRIYPTLVLRGSALEGRMQRGEYRPMTLEEGISRTARVMELFGENPDIRIIRVGLHPSDSLEQTLVAGPYHPAFRELCEGELMLSRLLAQCKGASLEQKTLTVAVAPGELSRMLGQRRRNAERIARMGGRLVVVETPGHPPLFPTIISLV